MIRRLSLLACFVAGAGCVTPEDRRDWADAMRDFRGDNMRMQAGSGPAAGGRAPALSEEADADRPARR